MGKGVGTIIGGVGGGIAGFFIAGPAGAAALGAAGAQAGAGLDAAKAEEKAAKTRQGYLNAQADEVMRRAAQNAESTRIEGIEAQGNQSSQIAGSGVQVGSLSSLVAMETTASRYREEMNNIYLDAKQEADAIRYTGQAGVDQAKRNKKAAVISGVTGLVGTGAMIGMNTPKTGGGSSSVFSGAGSSYPSAGNSYSDFTRTA